MIVLKLITALIDHIFLLRLVLGLSMLYELILIFTLFQHEDDVRRLLVYVDPKLGTPLEEMDYRWVIGYRL